MKNLARPVNPVRLCAVLPVQLCLGYSRSQAQPAHLVLSTRQADKSSFSAGASTIVSVLLAELTDVTVSAFVGRCDCAAVEGSGWTAFSRASATAKLSLHCNHRVALCEP